VRLDHLLSKEYVAMNASAIRAGADGATH
jgi:hypothetical protein